MRTNHGPVQTDEFYVRDLQVSGMTTFVLASLISHLDSLAVSTWHKVEVGPSRGLMFREESFTGSSQLRV